MENDEYLNLLILQFKKAKGINKVDINSIEFMQEFQYWLQQRSDMIKYYQKLLNFMHLSYKTSHTAEVGKGYFDSVVSPFETTIITPYQEGFEKEQPRIINSALYISKGNPYVFQGNELNKAPDKIETFMTQNPYEIDNIRFWEQLPSIIVGIYGNIRDKDKKEKERILKDLKAKMSDLSIENGGCVNDTYYYVITNDTKIKIRKKRQRQVDNRLEDSTKILRLR